VCEMHGAGLVSTPAASAVVKHWKAVYWETRTHRLGRGGRKRTGLWHLGGRLLYLVVICAALEGIAASREAVERWLAGMGLHLSPTKTRVTHTLHPLVLQRDIANMRLPQA